jgi:ABC-type multidrug transport system ATPase subunit
MTKISCEVRGLSQRFHHFYLFKEISFSVSSGKIWMIKGNNGAGKSTLLKILSGAMEACSGEVVFYKDEKQMDMHSTWKNISLVAPYQELPEELSLSELIDFQVKMSTHHLEPGAFSNLVSIFEMDSELQKPLAKYSTGMKQKAKIILAFGENRPIIFLDEPTSNLDPASFEKFWAIVSGMKNDKLIIVASNDEKEISFGKLILSL